MWSFISGIWISHDLYEAPYTYGYLAYGYLMTYMKLHEGPCGALYEASYMSYGYLMTNMKLHGTRISGIWISHDLYEAPYTYRYLACGYLMTYTKLQI